MEVKINVDAHFSVNGSISVFEQPYNGFPEFLMFQGGLKATQKRLKNDA